MGTRRRKPKHSPASRLLGYILYGVFGALWLVLKGAWWLLRKLAALVFRAGKRTAKRVAEKQREAKAAAARPTEAHVLEHKHTVKGSWEKLEEKLRNGSLILVIAGRRGSGKSATGFALVEHIAGATRRACYALDVPQKVLPSWIASIRALEDARQGGVVIVDEGAVAFGARESMRARNKSLSKLMALARHNGLTLIFVTQSTGMLDRNVLALCDAILLKEGSLMQEELERPALKKLYALAKDHLKRKQDVYIFSNEFEGRIANALPSFWTHALSTYTPEKE